MSFAKWIPSVALVALVAAPLACSDDGAATDAGPKWDHFLGEGGVDLTPTPDAPRPDMDLSKKPEIDQLIPDNGFSDGGSVGKTPVVMTGKNFAQGARIFLDGGSAPNGIIYANVQSPVSLSFDMPKYPYGDPSYDKPGKVSVAVMVDGMLSDPVDFQYTVSAPMDATFKGVVITTQMDAYAEFLSDPIEGKVFVDGVTTATGDSGKIVAQVGRGTVGKDPSKDPGWRWYDAKFVRDDGDHDVYAAGIKPPRVDTFDVAFRFSQDGGQTWVYADRDDSDLAYDTSQAAKLVATKAPDGYCQSDDDCLLNAWAVLCKVDPQNKANNRCVECEGDSDCTDYGNALGPMCNTSKNLCYCNQDTDCAKNPNGAMCVPASDKYCGCAKDTNCVAPKKCVQDPATKMQTCQ